MNLGNAETNHLVKVIEQENKYYSDVHIKPDDENSSIALIVKNVKEKSKVLDIGCSFGLAGEYLHKHKKCSVYGIEVDKKACEVCEKNGNYKKIYNFSISDTNSKQYKEFLNESIKFDYIILADVLEHLVDPADTLYNVQKLLNDNGRILVSLPNVAHFDIINGLCENKFNYNTYGLLDNTHIKFFTDKSFAQMIMEMNKIYKCNLDMKRIGQVTIYPDFAYNDSYMLRTLRSKIIDAYTLQYILEIKKSNSQNNLKQIAEKTKPNILQEMQDEIDRLNEHINDLESSKSWKITKPLRTISYMLRTKK